MQGYFRRFVTLGYLGMPDQFSRNETPVAGIYQSSTGGCRRRACDGLVCCKLRRQYSDEWSSIASSWPTCLPLGFGRAKFGGVTYRLAQTAMSPRERVAPPVNAFLAIAPVRWPAATASHRLQRLLGSWKSLGRQCIGDLPSELSPIFGDGLIDQAATVVG
jgi:hypothetical protein